MTEDDLSIFRVRSWTRHVKLGGVRLLRFFDTSLRFRDIAVISLPQFGSDPPCLSTVQYLTEGSMLGHSLEPKIGLS